MAAEVQYVREILFMWEELKYIVKRYQKLNSLFPP
jgi:hypothetical protein